MTREEHELLLKVQGQAQLEQLRRELEKEEAALLAAAKAAGTSAAAHAAFEALVVKSQPTVTGHTAAIAKLEKATDEGGKASRQYAVGIQQAGYALGDLGQTSGDVWQKLSAVTNNIQYAAAGLGPWGVAIGVAAVAAVSLGRNWETLAAVFGRTTDDMRDRADKLKEKIKELEDQKVRLAVDDLELRNARKEVEAIRDALAAVEKLRNLRSSSSKESGAAIEKAIGEMPGGGQGVLTMLEGQFRTELTATDSKLAEARKEEADQAARAEQFRKFRGTFQTQEDEQSNEATIRTAEAKLAAAQERAKKETDKIEQDATLKAGGVLKGATEGQGDEQRRAQAELARRGMQAGREDIAVAVESNTPEQVDRREQEKARFEQAQEAEKARKEAEKEAADARAKAGREADAQMAEAARLQDQMDREAGRDAKSVAARAARNQGETQKRFRTQRDAEARGLAETPFDEEAAAAAAQYRAQGGVMNPRTGRVTKADEAGQLTALAEDLFGKLAQAIPDKTMRGAVATKMAQNAFGEADEAARRNQMQLVGVGGQNLNATQKNQVAIAATQQAVQQLGAMALQANATANQLIAQGRALIPRGRAPGR